MKIGVGQIYNSTDVDRNFRQIIDLLFRFRTFGVDLVLFPECGLSGFTSKMRECTGAVLLPYLAEIQSWVNEVGIDVVLPTAIVEAGKIYNSGFWIHPGCRRDQFYKTGLTETEKKFFAIPDFNQPKVFEKNGVRFAVLICCEAEHAPWSYFQHGEADVILWPGYWGSAVDDQWSEEKESGRPNPIYANMLHWKLPLIQANFAANDLGNHKGAGPEGLSLVVDQSNRLVYRGAHLRADGFVVYVQKKGGQTSVVDCVSLPEAGDYLAPVVVKAH
ncbi:MAG: carbon-nitrogen hydrolase family protein [Bdellovibrionales bacterium]|nr:carbon-nitrogen hydrolase family protein [Bdellovibrionales bacterium]